MEATAESRLRIIRTHETKPNSVTDPQEREWIYNGLDCAVTMEVLEALVPQLDPCTSRTYSFSKALQGPALEMRLRGVLVDNLRKAEVIEEYFERIDHLERNLDRLVWEGLEISDFNWRSPAHLRNLFYEVLEIPPVRRGGKPTVSRDALEKLNGYFIARPFVMHITEMRDLGMKIKVLKQEVDKDGRIRTSYNIAGTSTGRFSSSFSEFGTGGNLQNVEESLRSIFVADTGYKFAKFDAKSGESYCVGAIEWNLFHDGRFLDAVESGDIHTYVARLVWPDLGWTSNPERDRTIADGKFYRHLSYRDMCKKAGHGSNYGGKAPRIAEETKLPVGLISNFQSKYHAAFPAHIRWHSWVASELRRRGCLISLTGRKRWFLSRRTEPSTIREAIAYDPQGSLADIVNTAMLQIWRWIHRENLPIHLMMQEHDALTFMYPEAMESQIIPELQSRLIVPITLAHNRILRIPYDCQTGWNKGKCHATNNPDGLKDWAGSDQRRRTPQVSLLDRVIRKKYGASGVSRDLSPMGSDWDDSGSDGAESLDEVRG